MKFPLGVLLLFLPLFSKDVTGQESALSVADKLEECRKGVASVDVSIEITGTRHCTIEELEKRTGSRYVKDNVSERFAFEGDNRYFEIADKSPLTESGRPRTSKHVIHMLADETYQGLDEGDTLTTGARNIAGDYTFSNSRYFYNANFWILRDPTVKPTDPMKAIYESADLIVKLRSGTWEVSEDGEFIEFSGIYEPKGPNGESPGKFKEILSFDKSHGYAFARRELRTESGEKLLHLTVNTSFENFEGDIWLCTAGYESNFAIETEDESPLTTVSWNALSLDVNTSTADLFSTELTPTTFINQMAFDASTGKVTGEVRPIGATVGDLDKAAAVSSRRNWLIGLNFLIAVAVAWLVLRSRKKSV